MKYFRIFLALLTVALVNLSCGLSSSGEQTSSTEQAALPSEAAPGAYPTQEAGEPQAYPTGEIAPLSAEQTGSFIYPELKDGDAIEWSQVPGLINSGLITKVVQTGDLKVYMTIADGRTLATTQPALDEIQKIISNCGQACKDLSFATE